MFFQIYLIFFRTFNSSLVLIHILSLWVCLIIHKLKNELAVIDIDNDGIKTDLSATELFSEVYNTMIDENNCFKQLYGKIVSKLYSKPILFVKNKYTQIYKISWLKLNAIRTCNRASNRRLFEALQKRVFGKIP